MSVSGYLLAALGIVFVLQLAIAGFTEAFIFDPSLAFVEPWRFVTSMFLHANLTHIFFNGYALLMFGSMVERRMNSRDFLLLYFGAGLLGGFLYYATYIIGMIPPIPALGASGAIYGLLGAAAVFFPDVRILLLGFMPMSMRRAAAAWFVMEFVGTFDISSGIASAAHLGGLIFGLAFAWYLKGGQGGRQEWSYAQPSSAPWEQEQQQQQE